MKKLVYRWYEAFDGGESSSKDFDNFEDCKQDMILHCNNLRFTKKELEKLQKRDEAFLFIDEIEIDSETGDEKFVFDGCDGIEINEDTAMIYND